MNTINNGDDEMAEIKYYVENHLDVANEEKLCANFINCGKRTGGAVWYIAGAHYCEECGQKTYAAFQNYVVGKTEVSKTVNGYSKFKVRFNKDAKNRYW